MFSISVISVVDDGARTCFWTDRWLHGQSIKELAPTLIKSVPKRALNCRTVRDAVHDLRWVRDIQGALSAQALFEYFLLLDILDGFQLSPECRISTAGHHLHQVPSHQNQHTNIFFVGSIHFEPAKRVWKSWAPPRCKFLIWLALLNRCWTADRLAHRGLDHPDHCPLCDQEDETIQHILTSCVFAREIWFRVLSLVGLQQLTPSQDDFVFQEWWRLALTRVSEQQQKGFNSSVILVAW
jgi:hypothetical protein